MPWISEKIRTAALTGFALLAFAANSVLCRLALGQGAVDAASFSAMRLLSGAATLLLIFKFFVRRGPVEQRGDWLSAFMLLLYAVAFSFAYVSLTTATGALILFAAVQATMLLAALKAGEIPHPLEAAGILVAVAGLLYLTYPGLSAPSPLGSLLMALAGGAWGIYTLQGREASDPVATTACNFARSAPFVLAISLIMLPDLRITSRGALLAVLSGALASGLGYVVWYAALRRLSTTRAAGVQLSVPVLAALGGVVFLSEEISARLVLSAIAILSGVGLSLLGGKPAMQSHSARHRPKVDQYPLSRGTEER